MKDVTLAIQTEVWNLSNPIADTSLPRHTNSSSNVSLSYHRKNKKQKKMKMMILKHGRIMNDRNNHAVSNFHYFPEGKKDLNNAPEKAGKKSLKNSKSRTRYAEYNEKDETIDDQI